MVRAAEARGGRDTKGVARRIFILLALLLLSACSGDSPPAYAPEYSVNPPPASARYVFAPHPLLNPQKLAEVYGGMVELMNRRLAPGRIQLALEASSNYRAFNEKLKNRRVDFALPNPYQTLLAQDVGYVIFGKMDNDEDFRGVIIVRREAGIRELGELKGRRVCFPAPTALAATLLPELYLKEHGLDPRSDIIQLFVGTHESTLMNASIGSADAACTWPPAWRLFQAEHPRQARKLELRWWTGTMPQNGLVARADLPEHVRAKVAEAFLTLHESEAGRRLLAQVGVSRFVPAERSTFEPVRAFTQRYSAKVRQLRGLDE